MWDTGLGDLQNRYCPKGCATSRIRGGHDEVVMFEVTSPCGKGDVMTEFTVAPSGAEMTALLCTDQTGFRPVPRRAAGGS